MTSGPISKAAPPRSLWRLAGYTALAQLALAVLAMPLALAHAEHTAESIGLALLDELGPVSSGPPRALEVNGQRLFFASRVTEFGVAEVLDLVERRCQGPASPDLDGWLGAREAGAVGSLADARGWRTARSEASNEAGETGQVACFAPTPRAAPDALEAAQRLIETGDLSGFGDARYVVARRDAAAAATHVLVVWSEGSFDVRAMFPAEGDAPGRNPSRTPRPLGGVRQLSAQIEGEPYGIDVYATPASAQAVVTAYARELEARGFEPLPLSEREAAALGEPAAHAFVDAQGAVLIVARARGAETRVSVLELDRPAMAHAAAPEAR